MALVNCLAEVYGVIVRQMIVCTRTIRTVEAAI